MRGYDKRPCTQFAYSQGFAVGRVRPYPCGCIRLQPVPLYIDDLESDSTIRLAVGLNILLLQISGDYL